ncbi:hypothetical protein COU62_02680 [Candidatus Pacearchaeota archaeon CG10_big_fil_rev_8_21_14_0_10_35_219]|nr:hypothetical protein [Candidatus Pacearchaeota archaeon]OIO43326.1 MAG: hypothetical protein AUJ63_00325 [Candidatus Pacearchaeota archaeon CG1_02_35_32]PIO07744.1 MAG: hypothetical protein COU62_02680 [Candidatus Pacearchaeota archaeon CG10_big_fil_rev_8_21_14_0_10_35_219]PIY81474.1 MAG: hypothetical protein COY79_01905 [Candidatus Pacearchaeota archaeon CG_4_10_14_0_8_um_filter_35_169]PIZ80440.1 MAG: hypothetical protein COY00_01215 [Candidatus Pacearchaeota archaeon CG_4_10_14_0_2_um_filt
MNRKATLDIGEPKDIDEKKLKELIAIMDNHRIRPLKIFIVGKKQWLRVYGGNISHGLHREEFGEVIPRRLDRGEILDSFTKIEFMTNEIIQAIILKEDFSARGSWLDSLNTKIDFSQKIHILRDEWKLISDDTFQMLNKLKNVRNVLAHSWDFGNAVYGKDKTLETNFPQFCKDLKEVWKRLVVVYENLQPQNELMDKLILELKKSVEQRKNENKTN